MSAEPKDVKKEMWLLMLMGMSGFFDQDYEIELDSVGLFRVDVTISFDAEKKWETAKFLMNLIDGNYGLFEAVKRGDRVRVAFSWPTGIDCPYVKREAS